MMSDIVLQHMSAEKFTNSFDKINLVRSSVVWKSDLVVCGNPIWCYVEIR